jgi:hypothetical protein
VPVTVAGKELNFRLELSDAYSGITSDYAKKFALAESGMPREVKISLEDVPVIHRVAVPVFQMDRLVGRDLKLLEITNFSGADGKLGLDILSAQDVELDLAHDKLKLFSRYHCSGKVIYWSPPGGTVAVIPLTIERTGQVMMKMSVDGKLLTVGITTSSRSTMGMNDAHRLFGIDEHSPGIKKVESGSKAEPAYRYPFHEIEAQGLKIENPDIVIEGKASDPECDPHEHFDAHGRYVRCYGGADLFLGPSILRRFHLFFAFGEEVLYATAE